MLSFTCCLFGDHIFFFGKLGQSFLYSVAPNYNLISVIYWVSPKLFHMQAPYYFTIHALCVLT